MPRADTGPRGRRDFRRVVARAQLAAARSGLVADALRQAAAATRNADVAALLRAVADSGSEHHQQMQEGSDAKK